MDWLIADLFPTALVDRLRKGDEQFVVTGATGWFGAVALGLFDEVYGAQARGRVHAYASRARDVRLRSGRVVPVHAIDALSRVEKTERPLHVLHFAFGVPGRAETEDRDNPSASTSSSLTELVSDALPLLAPVGFCFPSSGAVYGRARSDAINRYGEQKATDEIAFREGAAAIGARLVIPRVFAVGGPGNPDPERYLLGELVTQALSARTLRLRSANFVYRSFVSLADVLALVLTELLSTNGDDDLVFDACGREVVEALELAERVCRVLDRTDLAIVREGEDTDTEDRYTGDPTAFEALASRRDIPIAPLDDVIRQTALQ
jgi:nucleoside-diphosphate-sugar epimerase